MPKNVAAPAPATAPTGPGVSAGRPFSQGDGGALLPLYRNRQKQFMLGHHPSSWALEKVGGEWRLLPHLSPLVVAAGVNGTKAGKGKRPPSGARLTAAAKDDLHQVVIRSEEFLTVHPGRDGTVGYFTKWEKVTTYPDGTYEVEHDGETFAKWKIELVLDGRIAPPRPGVVARERSRWRRRAARAGRRPDSPNTRRTAEEADARLAGLDTAVKFYETEIAKRRKAKG